MKKFSSRVINPSMAALISSTSVGVWDWLIHLVFPDRLWMTLGDRVYVFFVPTLIPNLLGLGILAAVLSKREPWLHLCRKGLFIPIGGLYGLAIFITSTIFFGSLWFLPGLVLYWEQLFPVFRDFTLIWLYIPRHYLVAVIGGITAVGILVFLEGRSTGQASRATQPSNR